MPYRPNHSVAEEAGAAAAAAAVGRIEPIFEEEPESIPTIEAREDPFETRKIVDPGFEEIAITKKPMTVNEKVGRRSRKRLTCRGADLKGFNARISTITFCPIRAC